jgi:hypothetical protein
MMSGIIWRGAGNAKAMAYGYTYDKSGRLTKADFRRLSHPEGHIQVGHGVTTLLTIRLIVWLMIFSMSSYRRSPPGSIL